MRYLIKQLWPLVLLLIISIAVVIWAPADAWYRTPLRNYALFSGYVIIVGTVLGFLGRFIPRRFRFDRFPFKPYAWERDGRFYRDKLHIDRWKDKLTDMSKATAKVSSKAVGHSMDSATLLASIQEMCVAEVVHIVLILLSPSMFLFMDRVYALVLDFCYIFMNLLDIAVMRYNRPRVVRLYERAVAKEARS